MFYNKYLTHYEVPGEYDPHDIREFGIVFRAPIWESEHVYRLPDKCALNICVPTVYTGVYYKVINPGKAGLLEPIWIPIAGEQTTDGSLGLIWEAVNDSLMPPEENVIAVLITATNGVVITDDSFTPTTCQFTIQPLPDGLSEFTVRVRFTKDSGVQHDLSLVFTIGDYAY